MLPQKGDGQVTDKEASFIEEARQPLLPVAHAADTVPAAAVPARATHCLQASYALCACAWRAWEFAIALLLIKLYPKSLLMVSIYGLVDNGVRIFGGSFVGGHFTHTKLQAASRHFILAQNMCIGASAISATMLLLNHLTPHNQPEVYWSLMAVMILLGALSSIGSTGVRIAVENKAVQRLCGNNSTALSSVNSVFRAIDLTALLAAPLPVGALMTWVGPLAATLMLATFCMLAWVPELVLLRMAFNASEVLRAPAHVPPSPSTPAESPRISEPPKKGGMGIRAALVQYKTNFVIYGRQSVLLPNLSLALLYCTVLSMGFLMTSYMSWTGIPDVEVSMFRGIGALTGLAATAIFPLAAPRLGVARAGAVGSICQWVCLVAGVVPFVYEVMAHVSTDGQQQDAWRPQAWAVRCLVTGVVASRTGLWMFDLAITQLVQERVAEHELGPVCGVQSSLQAAFESLSFLSGVLCADPQVFFILVVGSVGVVTVAAVMYFVFMASWRVSP